jgi:hypothetical protein
MLPRNDTSPENRRLSLLVLAVSGAALAAVGCTLHPAPTATAAAGGVAGAQFVDVARQAGLTFRHQSGGSGRLYLPETMGAGCAFLDYDGDGWQDLFLLNSGRLPGFRGKGPFYPALYRNRGDGTFEDVTRKAGLAFECYGMGCAVGDYDNDGDEDLYVTALGGNHLFRNERIPTGAARASGRSAPGSLCQFVEVTRQAGVAGRGFSTSAAWVDYDCDGDLDLFVCHYAHWSPEINRICPSPVGPSLCRPDTYRGEPSVLYRNDGHGTFTDVSVAAGIASPLGKSPGVAVWDYSVGKSLGVAVWDYDRDGWPDLAIANDLEPNQLYRNNRDGTFRDVGVETGMSRGRNGEVRGGMGIDTADPLNDGHEVILVGDFSDEGLAFFRENGQGGFADQAEEVGLFRPSLPFVVFGALFCDYDLDGFPDILTANGHVSPHVDRLGGSVTFKQRLSLYHNTGPGPAGLPHFVEVGEQAGDALAIRRVWRGLAWADYDRDGDPDCLVTACNDRPMLLRNDRGNGNHWLKVRLEGVKSNREGLGSRVTVEAAGRRQSRWVRSGSSYASSSELKALFGLGSASAAERITVRWPSGMVQTLTNVAGDREILVEEGHGIVDRPVGQAHVSTVKTP